MELKEYFLIIKKQFKLFILVLVVVVASVFLYFIFRPVFFETSLFLNITRAGNQVSEGYKYDNFYRLQADEKFAETIVQWLKSPRIVLDIKKEAEINNAESLNLNLNQLAKVFQADKLSAQVVSVKFSSPDKKIAEKLALAIPVVLEKNINQLNEDQKESTWFEIKADDSVIMKNNPDFGIIFLVSVAVGLFLGFWVALFRHYWQ